MFLIIYVEIRRIPTAAGIVKNESRDAGAAYDLFTGSVRKTAVEMDFTEMTGEHFFRFRLSLKARSTYFD